ncbi:MAG TPA: bacteriohopanetetrol glucosamine biosynthesis glycosyltransferase HpnI [Tepidisphaeraceae bacterium]|nr:bacteriohopanetetrol glucosamine biosynthesis glycosyltransferase HpnI [Tepidisphaeraceae bacterium]
MTFWAAPALAGAAYYVLVLAGAVRWFLGDRDPKRCAGTSGRLTEPISILKPIRGRDPKFFEAIRSHASQDYPEFEILFGLSDPKDAAAKDIARLQAEFPRLPISAYVISTKAPNAKVGVLAELARRAAHPVLLVNDSDIVVEPGYLRAVVAPLADTRVGLVTCLYRAAAESWPSRSEALGIATEFAPSVIVARLLGVAEFALGSTMVFRADSLRAIGGFEALQNYLADDYQLGRHITEELRLRIEFAPVIVETDLGAESWLEVWRHQLRWSRTIRVSRRSGYYGYVVTHATLWALMAFAARQWWAGAVALGVRMLAGVVVGRGILGYRRVLRDCWMIPLRDLFGFAVWLGGLFGDEVLWRGKRLSLGHDGRIRL